MPPGDRAPDAAAASDAPVTGAQLPASALASVLETMASAFVLVDASATVLFLNGAAATMLGHATADVVGRAIWPYFDTIFESSVRRRCQDAMADRAMLRFDAMSAGALRWFEVSVQPACDMTVLHWHDISARKGAETALLESEERVRMTADAGLIGLFDWVAASGELHWSDHVYRILGFEPGVVVPSHDAWASRVHPDDLRRIESQLQDDATSPRYHDVHRLVMPDGTTRTVETRAHVTRDAAGRLLGMRGTYADITERASMDARLRESEARFRVMADDTPLGVWVTDAAGRILFANRRYCEFLGITRTVASLPDWSYLHPEDGAYASALAASIRTEAPFDARARIRRADGSWRWIATRGLPRFAPDGEFLGLVCCSSDITDHVDAEARERAATVHAHFRSLFEGVPGLLIVLKPGDYEIVAVSDAYLAATNTTRDRLVGTRLFDAFEEDPSHPSPDAYASLRGSLARVVSERRADVIGVHRFPMRRADGVFEERWWSPVSAPVLSPDGEVAYIIHRVEDVTAYVAARDRDAGAPVTPADRDRRLEHMAAEVVMRGQELQRANDQLRLNEGRLREEAAERRRLEEVRTRLIGQLVTAQEEERRRVARELHDTLGQHLTGLTLSLATLATRPEVPKELARSIVRLQQIAADIDDEVDRLAAQLRPPALDDLGLGEALRRHVETWGRDASVDVDIHTRDVDQRFREPVETTVYRVVQEALTNVRRHAHAGHVSVVVEHRERQLVAIVEDDGIGFDTNDVGKSPMTRFGMSTMRERAGVAGGRLDVESVPGKGTTVYLRVPVDE